MVKPWVPPQDLRPSSSLLRSLIGRAELRLQAALAARQRDEKGSEEWVAREDSELEQLRAGFAEADARERLAWRTRIEERFRGKV